MRIGIQNVSVISRTWSSEEDLRRFLEHAEFYTLIGQEAEAPREFYSLVVSAEPNGEILWTIGVLNEGHGLSPEALLLPELKRLFIGANDRVSLLSWEDRAVVAESALGFLFRSFIPDPKNKLVLAIHEAGVDAFTYDGASKWRFSRDVVETIHSDKDAVEIIFMDADPARLDVQSGRELICQ